MSLVYYRHLCVLTLCDFHLCMSVTVHFSRVCNVLFSRVYYCHVFVIVTCVLLSLVCYCHLCIIVTCVVLSLVHYCHLCIIIIVTVYIFIILSFAQR